MNKDMIPAMIVMAIAIAIGGIFAVPSAKKNAENPLSQSEGSWTMISSGVTIKMVTIEGHKYIAYNRKALIHAESCGCKKKSEQ